MNQHEIYIYTTFWILFFIFIGLFGIWYNQNKVVKNFLSQKYKEIKPLYPPVFAFKTRISFGFPFEADLNIIRHVISSIVSLLSTNVYFYEKFIIVKYMGYSQIFEYNKDNISIKKDFIRTSLILGTPAGDIYLMLNKKQKNILTNLIDKNSH